MFLNRDSGAEEFVNRSSLYEDWRHAFRSFRNLISRAYNIEVKFYRRDPGMWMVITDDKIFVEPYSFGRPPREPGRHDFHRRMGGHMPVFEFDRRRTRVVCEILEDHFDRLWDITMDDMRTLEPFYMDARAAAAKVKTDVFESRRDILEALHEILKVEEAHTRGQPPAASPELSAHNAPAP